MSMAFWGPSVGEALGNKNTGNATGERRGKQSTESSVMTFQEFRGGERPVDWRGYLLATHRRYGCVEVGVSR